MALRKRFRPDERNAFTPGTVIEWLNGSRWQPGEITGELTNDADDAPYYPIKHTGPTTRTVTRGEALRGYPGHIRTPTTS